MISDTDSCSLAIIGDGSVGKSSIINAFKTDGFEKVYKQTIGCDFYEKMVQVRGKFVSLKVWDIGGQSIHSKNIKQYVGSSNAIFLVYDVTNPESFSNLEDWLGLVHKHSAAKHVYVVGNKIDLIALRQITETQHTRFIAENSLQGGMFVSAKSGENVVKAFYQVAGDIIGIKLTQYELAFHDKVLTATIQVAQNENEGRTAFADEIEAEDLALEAKKKQSQPCCVCS